MSSLQQVDSSTFLHSSQQGEKIYLIEWETQKHTLPPTPNKGGKRENMSATNALKNIIIHLKSIIYKVKPFRRNILSHHSWL